MRTLNPLNYDIGNKSEWKRVNATDGSSSYCLYNLELGLLFVYINGNKANPVMTLPEEARFNTMFISAIFEDNTQNGLIYIYGDGTVCTERWDRTKIINTWGTAFAVIAGRGGNWPPTS